MDALKKSVADGKKSVASAISAKGVSTAADASFAVMAGNIGKIQINLTRVTELWRYGDLRTGETTLSFNQSVNTTGYKAIIVSISGMCHNAQPEMAYSVVGGTHLYNIRTRNGHQYSSLDNALICITNTSAITVAASQRSPASNGACALNARVIGIV